MSTTNPRTAAQTPAAQQFPLASRTDEAAVERKLASLYVTTAVPPALRDGPVTQTYGRRAARDAIEAARLREVQNLAAITAGHIDGVVLDDDPDTQHQLLAAALAHARHAAAATGISDEHILAAQDLGESGVPWVHGPAHRHLGRIEQLTAELATAHTGSTVLAMVAAHALQREHQARTEIAVLRRHLAHAINYPGPAADSAETTVAERATPWLRAVPSPQQTPEFDGPHGAGAGIEDAVAATAPEGNLPAWESGTDRGGPDSATGARSLGQEAEL